MNAIEKIEAKIAELKDDANKFYNNKNSAAGTRLRKGLQEIKTLAQEGRNEVTDLKNG